MNKKDGTLVVCIAMVLCLCLIPSAMASTEEKQTNLIKDAAQLKMEALEAELGEKGMKEVADYLELQASLPYVVKTMPYKALAFAATRPDSQPVYMKYIDNFDVSDREKAEYKTGLQDVWDRYPDKITKGDYPFMAELGPMIDAEVYKVYLEGKEEPGDVEVLWTATPHQDFAKYACDGSAYTYYAGNSADDPDNSGFEPWWARNYNHYEDAFWGIGGAPGRCDEFADDAITAKNGGNQVNVHYYFGLSSHYISDVGIPFHSEGATDYLGGFYDILFEASIHIIYESYVFDQWNTGYEYGNYVSENTQSITVNDPDSAVEDLADYSSQYYDYIHDEIANDPQNFGTDIYVAFYTARCVRETAKYNHGLYDYITT